MANRKINKTDIGKLLAQWAGDFAILVPSNIDGTTRMAPWNGKDTSFLENYRNTTIPPKDSIFPNTEEMFSFTKTKEGYKTEVKKQEKVKKIIFAIRPCDARAMALLDKTFNEDYTDNYYNVKRQNTMLVGLACTRPYDTCFCASLGSSPNEAKNMDVMLTDTGSEYLIEAISSRGKELINRTTGLADAAPADETIAGEVRNACNARVNRKVNIKDSDKKLKAVFEDKEAWEKIAAKCVNCGVCTFLCPTCYCFDITDDQNRQHGSRSRCWDSCQFTSYTQMPMENPRDEKWRRVRQKLCHKFEFFPMNYGEVSCTGCGRCIRLCPVNWDITQVLNNIPEKAEVPSK